MRMYCILDRMWATKYCWDKFPPNYGSRDSFAWTIGNLRKSNSDSSYSQDSILEHFENKELRSDFKQGFVMMTIGRCAFLCKGQTEKGALTVILITSHSYIIVGAELVYICNKD